MSLNFDQEWEKVQQSIDKVQIYLRGISIQSTVILTKKQYSESYTAIYNLCIQKQPRDFCKDCYDKYQEVIRNYLISHSKPLYNQKTNMALLVELKQDWDKYQIFLKFLNGFFSYLDRSYNQHNNLPTLNQIGEKSFKTIIIQCIKENLTQAFINELEKSRNKQISDLQLLNSIYFILKKLMNQDYQILLEFNQQILLQSQKTYSQFQNKWQSNCNYSEYLEQVESFLKEEEARLSLIFQNEIVIQILKLFYKLVILPYKQILIDEGMFKMLQNAEIFYLQLMYYLFDKLEDDFLDIKSKFKQYIIFNGNKIINSKIEQINQQGKDDINDLTFIKNLMNFQDSIQNLVQNTLQKNKNFERSMKEGFQAYLKAKIKDKTIAEYLAFFCDKILKNQGMERLSENEVSFYLRNIIIFIDSLEDKDIFMNMYHNYFAERILTGKFNFELEMQLIQQIKMRQGDSNTIKLEKMLNDYQQINDMNDNFQDYLNNHQLNFSFQKQIKVLEKSVWPVYKQINSFLPKQIKEAQNIFSQFYQENNKFYNLEWINLKSIVVLNIQFTYNKHEVTLNLLQASILYLFENKPKDYTISFQFIKANLNYEDQIIKNLLAPLCLGKANILIKKSEQKVITDQDQFQFNYDLKWQNKKITFPFVLEEQVLKKDKIQDNRELVIMASIMRILKTRKILKYQEILQEVSNSLQMFQPDITVIKILKDNKKEN